MGIIQILFLVLLIVASAFIITLTYYMLFVRGKSVSATITRIEAPKLTDKPQLFKVHVSYIDPRKGEMTKTIISIKAPPVGTMFPYDEGDTLRIAFPA